MGTTVQVSLIFNICGGKVSLISNEVMNTMNGRKLEHGHGHGINRKSDFLINMKMDRELSISWEITHSHSGQFQRFQSFLELVLLMQSKMDETGFPQSTHEIRTWENKLIPLTAGRFEAYEK